MWILPHWGLSWIGDGVEEDELLDGTLSILSRAQGPEDAVERRHKYPFAPPISTGNT